MPILTLLPSIWTFPKPPKPVKSGISYLDDECQEAFPLFRFYCLDKVLADDLAGFGQSSEDDFNSRTRAHICRGSWIAMLG